MSEKMAQKTREKRLVWDLPTRLFHWLLVASILASYLTADAGAPSMIWHLRLGYWTLGLIIFRILWGIFGPRHARFSNFIPGPRKLLAYSSKLLRRDSTPAVGHNPMGAFSVLLLLAMVGAQAVTGLFITDDIVWSGPWNPAVSTDTADTLRSFHHLNFDVLIWVIALHVAMIIFYGLYKRQNLLVPMFTGNKLATIVPPGEEIRSSELVKALVFALLSAAAVYAVLALAPPPVVDDYY